MDKTSNELQVQEQEQTSTKLHLVYRRGSNTLEPLIPGSEENPNTRFFRFSSSSPKDVQRIVNPAHLTVEQGETFALAMSSLSLSPSSLSEEDQSSTSSELFSEEEENLSDPFAETLSYSPLPSSPDDLVHSFHEEVHPASQVFHQHSSYHLPENLPYGLGYDRTLDEIVDSKLKLDVDEDDDGFDNYDYDDDDDDDFVFGLVGQKRNREDDGDLPDAKRSRLE